MTNREKPFSGRIELSPPVRRFPEWPPDENIPPILNENSVFLEVGASAGYRDNWYHTAAMFVLGGMFWTFLLIYLQGGFHIKLLYMSAPPFVIALICLIGTVLTPSALPLRVNRLTQELYYVHNHKLYKASWQNVEARAVFMSSTVATGMYILYFILHREGDQKPLIISAGGGRSQEHALRDWEYFCMYMENGTPVPILLEVPEDQKCAVRKNWETPMTRLFGRHANFMMAPETWLTSKIERLSLRPNRWPEEVISVCEKHPILQTAEGRASMITNPGARIQRLKAAEKPKDIVRSSPVEEKTWATIEKRGDFED